MDARYVIAGLVVLLIGALVATTGGPSSGAGEDAVWLNASLTDVTTGENYSIGSFDEPVLVETFAVWCTTCTRQQEEVKRLHEMRQDFVSVSLNTDPNEGAGIVIGHVEEHGFSWRYSVAPTGVVGSLIDEFGSSITVAPQAPMVIVCPDGMRERLDNGVKPASYLSERLDEVCSA